MPSKLNPDLATPASRSFCLSTILSPSILFDRGNLKMRGVSGEKVLLRQLVSLLSFEGGDRELSYLIRSIYCMAQL